MDYKMVAYLVEQKENEMVVQKVSHLAAMKVFVTVAC